MLHTTGEKMKPLRGFGFLELHFSIEILSLREKHYGKNIDEWSKNTMRFICPLGHSYQ
jgi:hypothetical protein